MLGRNVEACHPQRPTSTPNKNKNTNLYLYMNGVNLSLKKTTAGRWVIPVMGLTPISNSLSLLSPEEDNKFISWLSPKFPSSSSSKSSSCSFISLSKESSLSVVDFKAEYKRENLHHCLYLKRDSQTTSTGGKTNTTNNQFMLTIMTM